MTATNAKVLRPTLFNYIYTREETEFYANELWKMMIEDKFTVRIHEIYPLKDVARAHTVRDAQINPSSFRGDFANVTLLGHRESKDYG